MKHQYFGDVNDCRKYGLLRALQAESGLTLAVWWMLTPDDGRNDGKFIDYLGSHRKWRTFDPDLFDTLAATVPVRRHLGHVEQKGILSKAILIEGEVPDDRKSRAECFSRVFAAAKESDLVFFDPDNGFEVPSCRSGRRGSSKYLLWDELVSVYSAGKSVLVYQHFPRVPRHEFVQQLLRELTNRTDSNCVSCFETPKVGFFLAAQPGHADAIGRGTRRVARDWAGEIQIKPILHMSAKREGRS